MTFCTEAESTALHQQGWLPRLGLQYHWHNRGYATFDDFLATLSARKRKSIKRERRDANAAGLTFETLQGASITQADWQAFYQFYRNTIDRKWGSAYLSAEFFPLMAQRLGERVVLILARNGSTPVAAALNLAGGDTLYGRYWGATEYVPGLHFETCYNQAIQFCIAQQLRFFEGGAQGEHKLSRGLLPTPTSSAHWIADPRFAHAIEEFLHEEAGHVARYQEALSSHTPFKTLAG